MSSFVGDGIELVETGVEFAASPGCGPSVFFLHPLEFLGDQGLEEVMDVFGQMQERGLTGPDRMDEFGPGRARRSAARNRWQGSAGVCC